MSEEKTQRGEEMAALRGRAESWVVPRNSPAGGRSSSRPCIQLQHGALVPGSQQVAAFFWFPVANCALQYAFAALRHQQHLKSLSLK